MSGASVTGRISSGNTTLTPSPQGKSLTQMVDATGIDLV